MKLLIIMLFALELNLDSFGCGVAYGARRIKVPLASLLIISLISVGAISISMLAGNFIGSSISPELAKQLGGIILLCIGARGIYLARKVMEIRIPPLGLVVQILKEPASADLDTVYLSVSVRCNCSSILRPPYMMRITAMVSRASTSR